MFTHLYILLIKYNIDSVYVQFEFVVTSVELLNIIMHIIKLDLSYQFNHREF